MFVCASCELSCRSCHGVWKNCLILFRWWSFWSDLQWGNGNADNSAPHDEWKCCWWWSESDSADPPELHSAESTAGHAVTPPVAGTVGQVWERAGPIDIHLLEYIESKTSRNTKRKIDQYVHWFREFLVQSPHHETCGIGEISAKELNVLIDLKKTTTDGSD